MNRAIQKHSYTDLKTVKRNLLAWSQQFDEVVWLDSNSYDYQNYPEYEAILAVEAFTSIETSYQGAFDRLEEYQNTTKDWIFGYLGYDLKNDTERLTSKNDDGLGFSDLHFFQPKKIFLLKDGVVEMHYLAMVDDEMDKDWEEIQNANLKIEASKNHKEPLSIKLKIHKEAYKEKIQKMLDHIHRGDIYEANLCQEFYAHGTIDPFETYKNLNAISTPPFATFMRLEDKYLLSATPERYLKKIGDKIVSQPIKGTSKRGNSEEEDSAFAKALSTDPKERSENVMIVDLVRNDLSRTAKKGSVAVEELCKVYPFKQVYQMISTVVSEIGVGISPVDVIRSTFPMGSMTGAPKVSAMKIIENLEASKRGLYSGAVGYFKPNGDFDFNVIIRSILYNATEKYISYSVGGAITAGSDPEKEYAECLLKAKAMRAVLEGKE
ncbi:aminodeoxychorismate synthase component I [Dokdonia sinensis]|uniref:Aminodeoxychorismate synthase component I n=1 Tax=Dokdonia sinensis TaxID=2479847 RepID=A0A3M0FYY2_9FLAO|nr:aminodeoxychorismate synthase component I [Dokdonia sinensis]RMB57685.1 aminodeoxychorismate synthase component I [Dokdonia sinensis]